VCGGCRLICEAMKQTAHVDEKMASHDVLVW
jgi:hypothetical protein